MLNKNTVTLALLMGATTIASRVTKNLIKGKEYNPYNLLVLGLIGGAGSIVGFLLKENVNEYLSEAGFGTL